MKNSSTMVEPKLIIQGKVEASGSVSKITDKLRFMGKSFGPFKFKIESPMMAIVRSEEITGDGDDLEQLATLVKSTDMSFKVERVTVSAA